MGNGILLLNKQEDITSNNLVQLVKKKFNSNKVGHTGTLDPFATGLMIILLNEATKISNFFLMENKEYIVEMKFFTATDTGDVTGKIIAEEFSKKLSEDKIKEVMIKFNNYTYLQKPPIYSAIKYQGKKLYQYARSNINIDPEPRKVKINNLKFHWFNSLTNTVSFTVNCSKGTYIRSLVLDIANCLETIAVTTKLIRTKIGSLEISQAKKINDINKNDIISIYRSLILTNQPVINVDNEIANKIKFGQKLIMDNINLNYFFPVNDNNVLGIYQQEKNNLYRCQRLINNNSNN